MDEIQLTGAGGTPAVSVTDLPLACCCRPVQTDAVSGSGSAH